MSRPDPDAVEWLHGGVLGAAVERERADVRRWVRALRERHARAVEVCSTIEETPPGRPPVLAVRKAIGAAEHAARMLACARRRLDALRWARDQVARGAEPPVLRFRMLMPRKLEPRLHIGVSRDSDVAAAIARQDGWIAEGWEIVAGGATRDEALERWRQGVADHVQSHGAYPIDVFGEWHRGTNERRAVVAETAGHHAVWEDETLMSRIRERAAVKGTTLADLLAAFPGGVEKPGPWVSDVTPLA